MAVWSHACQANWRLLLGVHVCVIVCLYRLYPALCPMLVGVGSGDSKLGTSENLNLSLSECQVVP